MSEDGDLKRLRWRCRRGTRELDELLARWLAHGYARADASARGDFERLLDVQDPQLWDWLSGVAVPDEPALAALVDEIRSVPRV